MSERDIEPPFISELRELQHVNRAARWAYAIGALVMLVAWLVTRFGLFLAIGVFFVGLLICNERLIRKVGRALRIHDA